MKFDLYKGNCLPIMDKLIADGVVVDAIICDPPYGTTACSWDSIIPFEDMWSRLNKLIKPNGAIVLFGSEPFSSLLRVSNLKNFKYDWIWNKKLSGNPLQAKRQPLKIHEIIMVFNKHNYYPIMTNGKMRKKGGSKVKSQIAGASVLGYSVVNDEYYPTSIMLDFSNAGNRNNRLHPTQKPVALMEYLIKTYTNENEIVLDFTMGSGSTGVACRNTNRNFIGIEQDERYFKIAEDRINNIGSLF